MREQLVRLGVAACLLVPAGVIACDREDQKDFKEGVEDAEKEIDKNVDTDGKDD